MRRRSLLLSLAGWPIAQAVGEIPRGIIDTHTHFYDPSRPQGVPWPPKDNAVLYRSTLPERYTKLIEGTGIAGTIVVEASPWVEDNQWVLDLAKDNPIIVGLVGRLEPGIPDFASNLERFRKDRLFLGIRVPAKLVSERLARPVFREDLKRLADAGLSIDLAGGTGILGDVIRLNDRIPELRIVLDHLPYDIPADHAARSAYELSMRELHSRKTVAAKVSHVLRRKDGRVPVDLPQYRSALDQVWDTFGSDRVLYGSNWPVSDLIAPYSSVLKVVREYFAGKGKDAGEKYFRTNSKNIYRWVKRGT
ncbi:MAG: amidohydrolase family protein [Bryobacteraceae bacterium]